MLRVGLVLCALAAACAIPLENPMPFEVEYNGPFANWSIDELKAIMGTRLDVDIPVERWVNTTSVDGIPSSFDARTQWKDCIHPIRNQLKCGSCWAFGAAESFSDRLCIATGDKENLVLSPEDLVSCDTYGNKGCNGGIPHLAWDYIEFAGLPTDKCFPYTAGGGTPAACTDKCADGSQWKTYKAQKFSTKGFKSEAAIQQAIMTNGPVEAGFSVYQDFMNYKGGVYKHTSGQMLGGHAVKMVGWGEDNGQKYWTIANSWGTSWGEQGYFRILRGVNECGIEQMVCAGLPADKSLQVSTDSKLCTECKKIADDMVNKLINVIFQATVVGGCSDLCGKLDKKAEQEICMMLCATAGEVGFEEVLKKVQLQPENLCYDLKICKH